MKLRSLLCTAVVSALPLALLVPAPASAEGTEPGTRSLAAVLTSDGNRFDRNVRDFDIVTVAVLAVLEEKPDSRVGLLADGTVPLTAFVPNDFAFKALAKDLTGKWYRKEWRTFKVLLETVGVDAIESVLLYHVVPGVTIDSRAALQADGAVLDTALKGATFEVDVVSKKYKVIRLRDNDPDDVDPILARRALDINKGNLQIAHGMWFVLRPLDL